MLKAKLHTLKSGLRVVLVPMKGSPTATVEVRVETGSKYENEKEAGLSHFLEHMCFKGTEKRPSAFAVSNELDTLGAVSNAFTSTEVTGYYAKAPAKQVSKILDIVSDIYLHSVFKNDDIAREKGVITEEINMYEDQPQAIVSQVFEHAMHGDQPAGLPIIGTKGSVASFEAKDFYDYRKKHYVASATMITIAGDFDEKKILKEVKELFKDISQTKKSGKKRTTIAHEGPKVAVRTKESDQVHLVLGVRSFPYGDKRARAQSVLSSVLSGGMSARLFNKMREELGICYYVYASGGASTDHGEFIVASGVDPKRVGEAVTAILGELKKCADTPISKQELEKAKSGMIAKMYMALESSDAVADYFADRAMFHHDLLTPKERERSIERVTAEEVRRVAKTIFTDKDLVLAVVGRQADEQSLRQVLRFQM